MRMLEYDEELKLSDRIVERRQLVEKLGDKKPSRMQQLTISDGDAAINELVEAYRPGINARARAIWNSAGGYRSNVELDDLISEATLAAMLTARSFSCRTTKDGKTGVRFMKYARKAIDKAIKRHVAKMKTPFRLDVQVIQFTWAWKAAKAELRESLGREPSDAEVEAATDIAADYVIPSLPSVADFTNLDDPDSFDTPGISQAVQLSSEAFESGLELERVMGEYLSEECVAVLLSYFGVDRLHPRTPREVADHLRMKIATVNEYLEIGQNALMHPAYRVKFQQALTLNEAS